MVDLFKQTVTADELKTKAKELGADLVGIADGRIMDAYPPYIKDPVRSVDLTELDSERVIVMAKRVFSGTSKITRWNDRHKYYNDEIALSCLEEVSLEMVYWLEDKGYPGIIVPPTHANPWQILLNI